ncbi:M48 family metallopeptidase [Palleronia caenipelagi]|uniref:Peptidase M48 n=1 Tax=Palleronia caenipelagi TaxID=2489174 RepID=A0A547PXS2_9RHOB|nr:M48 family metallopeptidase [Palleronia caenipelagi]TRD18957.1 peptidase M48 [Palleronia caenipelagi]
MPALRLVALVLAAGVLSACVSGPVVTVDTSGAPTRTAPAPAPKRSAPPQVSRSVEGKARQFTNVVNRVMPVARAACEARTVRTRCDYRIVVDDRKGVPANAFQTLGKNGQPIVGFTLPLIMETRNEDELAFVLAHEAAHHIEGHIARGRSSAQLGAILAGAAAAAGGASDRVIRDVQNAGAFVGSRTFAKSFEIEADALGTVLAKRAGYDPIRGAEFFRRVPDPGNVFLGTHPPNADRIATVRRVAAGL